MDLHQVLHMNRGEDGPSYAENSSVQKLVILKVKHIVEESIGELCHSSVPKCINVAELGCSSGPNAFLQIKEIIKTINKVCYQLNHTPPLVQVFLNDLVGNDFNTLFKLLPSFYDKLKKLEDGRGNITSCFIAAMPGSFYGRLFPDHSIHFVHSSYSLHWLSQVPAGLVSKSGEPLNRRNIYIAETSPPSVHDAYSDQFERDFTTFLRMRSQEMVPQGHLALTFICKNDENDGCGFWELLGMTLHDMVTEGLIEEAKLATFNVPLYAPSTEELRQIIEIEASFKLRRLETFKLHWDANMAEGQSRGKYAAKNMRAVLEPILASHFGEIFMNDLFQWYGQKASEYMETGKGIVNNVVLLLVKQ